MSEFEIEKFNNQKSDLETSIGLNDPHFSKFVNKLIIEKKQKIDQINRFVGITMNKYIGQLNDEKEKHILESMKKNGLDDFVSSYLSEKQRQEAISSWKIKTNETQNSGFSQDGIEAIQKMDGSKENTLNLGNGSFSQDGIEAMRKIDGSKGNTLNLGNSSLSLEVQKAISRLNNQSHEVHDGTLSSETQKAISNIQFAEKNISSIDPRDFYTELTEEDLRNLEIIFNRKK